MECIVREGEAAVYNISARSQDKGEGDEWRRRGCQQLLCICEVHVKASLLWTVYRPGGTSNAEAMGGGIGGIIEKPAHVIRLTENRVYLTFVSSHYLLNLEV